MAITKLPTDFKDDVLASSMGGKRRYTMINNSDSTVSLEDATNYTQVGSSFGQAQVNNICTTINALIDSRESLNHNSICRGKYLGSSVTAAQWAAIASGDFDDLYIGDYWTIGGINYRIAAFDYYYNTGNAGNLCATHHVTIVPDSIMYNQRMNATNTTVGAYVGSEMYTSGLATAKSTINTAFGSSHVLKHKQNLQNAVTDGYSSANSWYDSTVVLMTEQNVFGCKIYGNILNGTAKPNNSTLDRSQYPLFMFRPDLIPASNWYWLRDVVSSTDFCRAAAGGDAYWYPASSQEGGVRPAFSIC